MRIIFIAIIISLSGFNLGAQTSNISFLSNNVENNIFKVSINSNYISNTYKSKHEINNLAAGDYEIKIVFDDAQYSIISETINIENNFNYTYIIRPSDNSKLFLLAKDSVVNLFPINDSSTSENTSVNENHDYSDPAIIRIGNDSLAITEEQTDSSLQTIDNELDFDILIKKVETSSRSRRYDVIKGIITNNSLSCEQSIELIQFLIFEEDKLKISKFAIKKVNDNQNIDLFIDMFKLPSSKKEIEDYISNYKN